MPGASQSCLTALFLALFLLQDPGPPAKPAAQPPETMAFSRVRIEGATDLIGASDLAATAEGVWVVRRQSGTVTRLDPKTGAVAATVAIGPAACGESASGAGFLWLPRCDGSGIAKIDHAKDTHPEVVPLRVTSSTGAAAFGAASLWVLTDEKGTIARVDPATGRAVAEIYLPARSAALLYESDALWVTSPDQQRVTRVDAPRNLVAETIAAGKGPRRLVAGEGGIWVLNQAAGSVSRIDPKANKVGATIDVGPAAASGYLAAGQGSIWVSAKGAPLARIDPRTNRLVQQFTGDDGGPLIVAHGMIWMIGRDGVVWRIDPKYVEALRAN